MKAYELLSDESKWCQGQFAVDKYGNEINQDNKDTVKWCLEGALMHCYVGQDGDAYYTAYQRISKALTAGQGISSWNDDPARTYAEVYDLLKRLDI